MRSLFLLLVVLFLAFIKKNRDGSNFYVNLDDKIILCKDISICKLRSFIKLGYRINII